MSKTPLHYAVEENSKDIIELLIVKGANLNFQNNLIVVTTNLYIQKRKLNENNQTPLHYAATMSEKEIGELLISKGADINIKDMIFQNLKHRF